jgi:FlgN protein
VSPDVPRQSPLLTASLTRPLTPNFPASADLIRTVITVEPAEDLSHQLWTMRELLEQLVYKLEVQGLLLAASRARWVPYVTAEIEAILEAIAEVENSRAAATVRVARQTGQSQHSSLAELIDHVPAPWAGLLAQHRLHLLSLQAEIEEISRANHEMAKRSLMRSREIIASLGEQTVDVYDPRGVASPLVVGSLRLDRTV